MIRAFKNRRPWAAAFVNLVLGPVFGMLYLNRGLYACCYWFAGVCFAVFCISFFPEVFPASRLSTSIFLASVPPNFVGAVHAFSIAKQKPWEPPLKWYAHWYSAIFVAFVLPGILALGIRTFVYRPFNIPASSMSPSVNRGDYLFASRFSYDFSSPERGDVVVFYEKRYRVHFIKRIVGMPGDRIQMKGGILFINGSSAPQSRISDWIESCESSSPCHVTQYEETLPSGRIVRVLDRDAHGSLDSTDVFVVPPDAYFVLGDNRDNSNDSRTDIGYVPRGSIIGKAAFKYIADGRWTFQRIN